MVRDTTISSLNVDEDFSFSTKSSLSFAHLSNGFERKQKRHPQISLESVVGVWHLRKKNSEKVFTLSSTVASGHLGHSLLEDYGCSGASTRPTWQYTALQSTVKTSPSSLSSCIWISWIRKPPNRKIQWHTRTTFLHHMWTLPNQPTHMCDKKCLPCNLLPFCFVCICQVFGFCRVCLRLPSKRSIRICGSKLQMHETEHH